MDSTDAQELLTQLPPLGLPGDFDGWQAAVSEAYEVRDAARYNPTEDLNPVRGPGQLRWRTLRLDGGRMDHPEVYRLGWSLGQVWPSLTRWGVRLGTTKWEHSDGAEWSPLRLDERGRLLLPPYIRSHLGVKSDGTVLTGAGESGVIVVAAEALEEALGLVTP